MLNWLKRVIQYEPAPVKIKNIEARLAAANGGHIYGDIEYEEYEDGNWELEVEIKHGRRPPEGPYTVNINGQTLCSLPVDTRRDETEKKFKSKFGDTLSVQPDIGMQVEVHTPAGPLLRGSFVPDR